MGEDLKKVLKKRLLDEMLGSVKDTEWSVLIMDSVTTRVMSSICRISEILDYGVSLVENIAIKREALPNLSGVYFITPSHESVRQLIEDFRTQPLYKTAHVFFSSPVSSTVLASIRACPGLTSRLKNLKEVNVEFLVMDRRTFVTDERHALKALFGENGSNSASYKVAVATLCSRLAGVFASLKEMPSIRFRASKPIGDDAGSGLETQALVSQRVALELNDRLQGFQQGGLLPASQTCDLIILDRGCDAVAPIIHEWTYEAMAYDLLNLTSNTFRYESETAGGKMESKEHILDERDELWVELRHRHFAEATSRIANMMDEFKAKNRAASYRGGGGNDAMDMRAMRQLVQGLPQYREQLAKLSVHVEIGSRINREIDERALIELGKLEQDLVFGDATSKEVIQFLSNHASIPSTDKERLLMCYAATHPEKLDAAKQAQWQKLARLRDEDMGTIINLEFLGVPVRKRGRSTGLVFGRKRKRAVRKDRDPGEDDQQYALSRFVPLLQEVLEDMAANNLSADDYPFVSAPTPTAARAAAPTTPFSTKAGSVRSNRSAVGWAKKAAGAPSSAAAAYENGASSSRARKLFVYVIGGITHSETRAAHKLSAKLNRDIIIGGSSLNTPQEFLEQLKELGSAAEHSALEIESNSRF
ncbi:probable protein transport Sec1a [Coccomyxa sp. Obi]|nr:probable protein transport Sec1a [Coccomyxa sp. Obi]